jgi:hypothetical protein
MYKDKLNNLLDNVPKLIQENRSPACITNMHWLKV